MSAISLAKKWRQANVDKPADKNMQNSASILDLRMRIK
ncbi:MAG: hypothetical protein ACI9XO_005063 [Paraglaciecola sp.]|jgi:hypothetical protein